MNETTEQTSPIDSPYVGLIPYEERHAPLFFGRDTDREMIIANLRAVRLSIFYGPSGVGKSSVLRAGVIPHLRERAWPAVAEGAPEFAVVYYKDWVNDPIKGLVRSVEEGIRAALPPDEPFEPIPPSTDLVRMLAAWTERFGMELLIILDQFEEYFLYRAAEVGPGTFADEFPLAVNRRDLPVRFLIALREDALSKLDRFKGHIPTLFETRLQISHLHDNDARAAISEPIPAYNTLNKLLTPGDQYDIEQELVEAVLEQVSGLKLKLGGAGQGTVSGQQAQYEIETPYLQLVMTRLWKEEKKAGSRKLWRKTLDNLGGADQIVGEHLDAVMQDLSEAEQEVAAVLFKYLVTPVGSKITHAIISLVEYATKETECAQEDVTSLLKKLESGERRILDPVRLRLGQSEMDGYQIYHDALAPAILAWRTNYLIARDKRIAQDKAAQARHRTLIIATAIWLTIVLTAGGTSLVFYLKYLRANLRANTEETKLNVVEGLASPGEKRQKEALDKLQQLKRQGTDLSTVTPIAADLAQQQSKALAISVEGVLSVPSNNPPPSDVQLTPRVYIHIQDERQREEARKTQNLLAQSGFLVPGIELVRKAKLARNELRYFRDEDKEIAREIVKVLRPQLELSEPKRIGGYENSPYIRPKHYELWFKTAEAGEH